MAEERIKLEENHSIREEKQVLPEEKSITTETKKNVSFPSSSGEEVANTSPLQAESKKESDTTKASKLPPIIRSRINIPRKGWLVFSIVIGIIILFGLIYFIIPKKPSVISNQELVNNPKLTAIDKFKARYGQDWQIELNPITQVPSKIIGFFIDSLEINGEAVVNKDNAEQVARRFIKDNFIFFKIDDKELKVFKIYEDNSSRSIKQKLVSVHFQQYYKDIPIYNSYTNVVFHNNKLVLFQSNYYPKIDISITPKVVIEEALGTVEQEENLNQSIATIATDQIYTKSFNPQPITAVSLQQITKKINIEDLKFNKSSLVIYPVTTESKIDYHLTWRIEYSLIKDPLSKPIFYLDAQAGKILKRTDYLFYDNIDGYVTGLIYPKNPGTGGKAVPFENEEVAIESYSVTTDKLGYYLISNLLGNVELASKLKGPYVDVNNNSQYDAYHSASLAAPDKHSWSWENEDNSYQKEESNVFYHTNFIHDYFTKADPFDVDAMDYPVKAEVGEKGSGNAFSDGTNIYFSGRGDDADATSLGSDIIYHEYTHLLTEHIYGPGLLTYEGQSGALHEGYSDYFAASILASPMIGEGIFPKTIRNLINQQKYPEDFVNEVHYDSLIFSGALWDVRESLGKEETDDLVIKSIKLTPLNFQEFLESLLLLDDNNGDLRDGAPHITTICDAFYLKHGIYSDFCAGYTSTSIADINSLQSGDVVKGKVTISGTATGSVDLAFQSYMIEYGKGAKPDTWSKDEISLVNDGNQKVINNILGEWNTDLVEDGQYTLKLTVKSGSETIEEIVLLEVDNTQPANLVGWPKEIKGASEPQIIDIDKDDRNELVVMENEPSGTTSHLNAYFPDGQFKKGINISLDHLSAEGSYTIEDINADKELELIKIHSGYLRPAIGWSDFGVSVWNIGTGKLIWKVEAGSSHFSGKGLAGPPVLADVDPGYTGLEIVLASGFGSAVGEKGGVTVLHANGSLMNGWPQEVDNNFGVRSSPAVSDIDHDGDLEIVAGGSENKVYVWHHDGTRMKGWPQDIGQNEIRSSPVLADLDLNGDLEIIVVLTLNEPTANNVYVFNHDGSLFKGWPKKTACEIVRASPAIGDLDKDGDLEIVIASGYNLTGSYSCSSTDVYVFNHDGSNFAGWPKEFDHKLNVEFSPILADINGDEYSEILVAMEDKVYAFKSNGDLVDPWPAKVSEGVIGSNLEVGDLDQDTNVEVVVSNRIALGKDKIYIWDIITGAYNKEFNEWPTLQHDNKRTGVYGKCIEDGTLFGECNTGSKYCDNGILKLDCRYCAYKCPIFHQCQPDGTCFNLCKKTPKGEVCPEVPFTQ